MSRHHRVTSTREWSRIRRSVFDRDGHRCRACGKAGRLEAHHMVQLARGGTNDIGNLRTLCRGCHILTHKRKLSPEESEWQTLVKELSHETVAVQV